MDSIVSHRFNGFIQCHTALLTNPTTHSYDTGSRVSLSISWHDWSCRRGEKKKKKIPLDKSEQQKRARQLLSLVAEEIVYHSADCFYRSEAFWVELRSCAFVLAKQRCQRSRRAEPSRRSADRCVFYRFVIQERRWWERGRRTYPRGRETERAEISASCETHFYRSHSN